MYSPDRFQAPVAVKLKHHAVHFDCTVSGHDKTLWILLSQQLQEVQTLVPPLDGWKQTIDYPQRALSALVRDTCIGVGDSLINDLVAEESNRENPHGEQDEKGAAPVIGRTLQCAYG